MKPRFLLSLFLSLVLTSLSASIITGKVLDKQGKALPFASILIKNTSKGTTANAQGIYSLTLPAGAYILVCQNIGYQSEEKKIKVVKSAIEINFELEIQQYELKEVVVSNKAEDPAYEIIRNTIKTREAHLKFFDNYKCRVYLKGQIQLRNFPVKFMGDTVNFEDGDTSKQKMLFLSETIANYSISNKNKKVEIVSTKVSGRSSGFGLGNPTVISFYENTISIGDALNPRGFVSPIADNALNYYKYKYMGSFYENGMEISKIKVTPKRKLEPLFTGYITIAEGQWDIHSVQLTLLKNQQLQLIDTFNIDQLYMPINNTWVLKQQINQVAGQFFKFDFAGTILQVYDQYEFNKRFDKKYFSNIVIKYLDSSNKKSLQYWDTIRPIALLASEQNDYVKKDSLEKRRQSPSYLDSMDRKRNKISFSKLIRNGFNYTKRSNNLSIGTDPFLRLIPVNFNPAEGKVVNFKMTFSKQFENKSNLTIIPIFRYGTSSKQWLPQIKLNYLYDRKARANLNLGMGTMVFQFNNNNPISESNNSINSIYWGANYMKTYKANFLKLGYSARLIPSVRIGLDLQYQDRLPMENIFVNLKEVNYAFKNKSDKVFSPNYPTNLMSSNLEHHQSLQTNINIQWSPGSQFLELPGRLINLGSKLPLFNLNITRGFKNIIGSDVDFTKWKFSMTQNLNLKLFGKVDTRFSIGGFLNSNKVYVPDYQHYLGNQTSLAENYMNGFQLLPYYQYSNTSKFYSQSNIEYHLNGFLSNKIPLFNKLNWFFVIGANALTVQGMPNYYETMFSIENIFKVARVDFVNSYTTIGQNRNGINFSIQFLNRR